MHDMSSSPPIVTPDDVINEANAIAQQAREVAIMAIISLQDKGYDQYAVVMGTFRDNVEKALVQLVTDLTPDEDESP